VQSVIKKITSKHLQKFFQYFAKTGLKSRNQLRPNLCWRHTLKKLVPETCATNS